MFGNNLKVEGLKVLIAEDNSINMLEKSLSKWGMDFITVKNGKDACEAFRQADFNLVLMDLTKDLFNLIPDIERT